MAKKQEAQAAEQPKKKKQQNEEQLAGFSAPARLREKYKNEVIPYLIEKFGYKNVMEVPKLEKIVVNMGLGADKDNPKGIEAAVNELTLITGQKPVITKAKKSIANFKLRAGMNVGAKVTLRGDRMFYFADKLMNIVLPRVRDFAGVSPNSFDGRGNYSIGLKEQLIFPEINYDDVEKVRGMDIIFVTTAKTDEEAKELLNALGMPFAQA
ncbi:MAG TPA: 50S ribosomal protein L5 [Clostridiales bacterium]|nr:50S ribosomal protein L5 [Clostridiales bacterium]